MKNSPLFYTFGAYERFPRNTLCHEREKSSISPLVVNNPKCPQVLPNTMGTVLQNHRLLRTSDIRNAFHAARERPQETNQLASHHTGPRQLLPCR